MAEALYRKYRPQIFEDVVGQESIERTLKNAIAQDKVSHAYLFTGPRGTGKTTTARLLAKALLCEHGPTPEPDGTCEDCRLIAEGTHPDVYELDAASRTGVENVREEIIGRVHYAPTRGRCKVYIIDEVHMLSTAAFNALLKTLEEPPDHVVFVLATTDPQKVPETIHSRCQRFDFRRISAEDIVTRLGAICVSEDVEFDGEALDLIAHRADGAMRNALTSLEQLIAFGDGNVSMDVAERLLGGVSATDIAALVQAIGRRDAAACFRWVADLVDSGGDVAGLARELAGRVRNLYVMGVAGAEVALDVSAAERREMADELPFFPLDRAAHVLGVLGDVMADLKTTSNARLVFEIALTRMIRPESDVTLESLAARVEALEAASPAGGFAAPAGQPVVLQAAPAFEPQPAPAYAAPVGRPVAQTAAAAQPAPAAAAVQAAPAVEAAAPTAAQPAAQPAPAAEAAASRPAAAATSPTLAQTLENPAALQRFWQGVLTAMEHVKPSLRVLFMGTKALYDAASASVRIEFPATNDFAFKASQKPDVQNELRKALAQQAGEDVSYVLVRASSAASVPSAATSAAASVPADAAAFPAPARQAAQPASAFRPEPASRVEPAQAAPFDAQPFHEDVPLDAYDAVDLPPWEDEPAPFEPPASSAAASEPSAAPASQSAVQAAPSDAAPAAQASASPQPAASGAALSSDDLQSMLNASWGGGIVVETI
ncbi:DNA polymerase III subunit gamma/tau [Eggerthellaceae bacterium zg-887]|uniref:DNA polymerase III subunit gamma/tau n=1 Tax=Xiamenia xianingshaonis TaxID=2682776 RepID=UPI00140C290B|nr:DNA polymerase III subunit gamma/tau [Xiamenia xianingshaonis]NHM16782.1 DNA polymerase III subunit gamma/tau [Xiamenia xianingshaonis]